MRVGLVSDTHGQLRPELLERLAGVERILHAGDVGSLDLLDELSAVAPVTAVWGNTDGFDVRARIAETARVELAGRIVVVTHGHQLGSPTGPALLEAHADADVVVYGHTHRPAVDRVGSRLAINPGAAGPARFRLRPSFAVLALTALDAEVQIIEL